MPIEIKELHIKVAVSPTPAADKPDSKGSEKPSPCDEVNKEQIVADCVEQILQILQEKMER